VGVARDVVVVGAGITGLATAYELARRGASVLVVERSGVGAAQSAGLTRIFRIAHTDPRLCALALAAREGWARWEAELDAGRLVGDEGLVVAGPEADGYARAMRAAGAAAVDMDAAEIAARIPLLGAESPWDGGFLDPLGGATRVRRTLDALAARMEVRRAEVTGVDDGADAATVTLADGSVLRAGGVVVCAGTETGPLAAAAGVELEQRAGAHVRLTYAPRVAGGWIAPACLIAPGLYALPVGSTGRWALGLDDPEGAAVPERVDDAYAAAVRAQHAEVVPRLFPALDPEPVDEIHCVYIDAPWLVAGEDGFTAARSGRVIAAGASNAMKFGPLLGERLAETALGEPGWVHPDLRLAATPA
jgi:glycine/D-amino acid oxidase-like deaminating enzyme